MKKINRKGFTLVELLAVLVVLSIVTGVAVPVTTEIVGDSKYRTLTTILDTAEEYLADQLRLEKIDPDSVSQYFTNVKGSSYNLGEFIKLDVTNGNHKKLIEEMGIDSEDVTTVGIQIAKDNIPCVVVGDMPLDSKFYNAKYWNKENISGTDRIVPDHTRGNHSFYSKCCIYKDVTTFMNNLY